jgi:predicted dehydrogenase
VSPAGWATGSTWCDRCSASATRIGSGYGLERWTTDLDEVLADPEVDVYFDTQVTSAREVALLKAIEAGKHVYTEKPVAESLEGALRLARAAQAAGITHGVVHDKLFLPGVVKLHRLMTEGFFGRVLSVRLEFGYWVFEGDGIPAQRPSWNYRSADGGGIVLDMFPHWQYLLTDLFGPISALYARNTTHIPRRWDEAGRPYDATADDAAYAVLEFASGVFASVNSSNSRWTAPWRARWPVCVTAPSSIGCPRRCRSGTPTCPTRSTIRPCGRTCRTTWPSTTASRWNGSCS